MPRLMRASRREGRRMTINADEIARLREIAEKATPGPWRATNEHLGWLVLSSPSEDVVEIISKEKGPVDRWQPNAAHIATFDPPTVLALLDELEKARTELAKWNEEALRRDDAYSALLTERDSARALLREATAEHWHDLPAALRARIAAELGDKL